MKFLAASIFLSVMELVSAHMELFSPAPRRSQHLSGVQRDLIDYSMTSLLGSERPFPCIGYGRGPIAATYKAGSTINVQLRGVAHHNGGHCQFSLSYDGKTFVGIKNIFGDCMLNKLSYDVTIPKDAPSGRAVFGWTWINRSGQREYYMNCADVKIDGNPNSKLTGNEIVIAHVNIRGKKKYKFPENFSDDFGRLYHQQTPVYTISPSSTRRISSNGNLTPSDKPQKRPTRQTRPPSKQPVRRPTTEPRRPRSSPVKKPNNQARHKPRYNTPSGSKKTNCRHGEMKCHNKNSFSICNHGKFDIVPCAATLRCTNKGKVNCVP